MEQARLITGTHPIERLDRVPEGMTEVQQHPPARAGLGRFTLVPRHHAGLERHIAFNQLIDRLAIKRRDRPEPRLHPAQQPRVRLVLIGNALADHRVLDTLGKPAPPLTRIERIQQRRVRHHHRRLVKGPHHVLVQLAIDQQVHARLATHRRVHHRQQRAGTLHHRDPTLVARRHKTRDITHDPAAKRDHRVHACQPEPHRLDQQTLDRLNTLDRFARSQITHPCRKARITQALHKLVGKPLRHARVPHHQHPLGLLAQQTPGMLGHLAQHTTPDADLIRPIGQIDIDHPRAHASLPESPPPCARLRSLGGTCTRVPFDHNDSRS